MIDTLNIVLGTVIDSQQREVIIGHREQLLDRFLYNMQQDMRWYRTQLLYDRQLRHS
jgi:hypothetical protein